MECVCGWGEEGTVAGRAENLCKPFCRTFPAFQSTTTCRAVLEIRKIPSFPLVLDSSWTIRKSLKVPSHRIPICPPYRISTCLKTTNSFLRMKGEGAYSMPQYIRLFYNLVATCLSSGFSSDVSSWQTRPCPPDLKLLSLELWDQAAKPHCL